MKGLAKRVARLEKAEPDELRPVLVLLHGVGHDPESIVGVGGFEQYPRLEGETAAVYLERFEAILRSTRGSALPVVGFATYPGDDECNS